MEKRICKATTKTGEPCGMPPLLDGDYCFEHEPALEKERSLTKSMGGKKIIRPIAGLNVYINSTEDVLSVLSEVIGNLRSMPISIQQAKALLESCEVALHVLELREFSERISQIENQLGIRTE